MISSALAPPATSAPDSDDAIAVTGWLHRRAGFGASPNDIRSAATADPIATLLDGPGGAPPDPWDGERLDTGAEGRGQAIQGWLRHLFSSPHSFIDRRTFMLHGWLVSSAGKSPAPTMADQIRLFMRVGGESFPDLLEAVTTDAAMLVFLDGFTSTAGAPNENYARELLELFALGTGPDRGPSPYTEDDVAAAATALTGWSVRRRDPTPRLLASRHDPTPQTLLGADGVSDVPGVIEAVTSHPEHRRFVADRIARELVGVPSDDLAGRPDPDVIEELVDAYEAGGQRLDAVIERALRLVVDGTTVAGIHHPIVSAPIPWMIGAARTLEVATTARLQELRSGIREMGQVPLLPPSVEGWPSGTGWLTTSSLIARTTTANALAAAVRPNHPVPVALADGDLDRAAALLGLLEPFSRTTDAAIRGAGDPLARLTLALISPEYLLT